MLYPDVSTGERRTISTLAKNDLMMHVTCRACIAANESFDADTDDEAVRSIATQAIQYATRNMR